MEEIATLRCAPFAMTITLRGFFLFEHRQMRCGVTTNDNSVGEGMTGRWEVGLMLSLSS